MSFSAPVWTGLQLQPSVRFIAEEFGHAENLIVKLRVTSLLSLLPLSLVKFINLRDYPDTEIHTPIQICFQLNLLTIVILKSGEGLLMVVVEFLTRACHYDIAKLKTCSELILTSLNY